VKNWEIEASFKPELSDWRTIDHPNYSFAINGGPSQTAEHMLEVGTYNAIIAPNQYYSPLHSDFASSHKTFKRMMPTFAWEVLELYSGPPTVAFKWRHWGQMKNDYVGFNEFVLHHLSPLSFSALKSVPAIPNEANSKGEKITAKAHHGPIDIEGVTVAHVDNQVRLQKVETWFDPLEMFRQIAPNGIVNKEVRGLNDDDDTASVAEKEAGESARDELRETANKEKTEKQGRIEEREGNEKGARDVENELINDLGEQSTLKEETKEPSLVTGLPVDVVSPESSSVVVGESTAGNAVAAAPNSEETQRTHEEMSRITAAECPFLMNKE
jgi:hypothetical protein